MDIYEGHTHDHTYLDYISHLSDSVRTIQIERNRRRFMLENLGSRMSSALSSILGIVIISSLLASQDILD